MELLNINWITILENSVSGIVAGLFISFVGFIVWVWQFYHQKKVEIYAEYMPYLFRLMAYYDLFFEKEFDEVKCYEINKEIMEYTLPLSHKFGIYFKKYRKENNQLIQLMQKIIRKEKLGMSKEEMNKYIYERFIKIEKAIK